MHYFSGKGCSEFLESMHYCIGILSIDENIELREFNKNEMDKIYFSEKMIREYPTKKLIDYFIPDEKERTSDDRNVIKDRLVYIINFFEYLSTKNPIIRGRGYGRQVKIIYLSLIHISPHSILPREAFCLHHFAEVLCECSQSLACVYLLPTYP